MDLTKIEKDLLELKSEIEARVERTHHHTHHRTEPVSANFSEQVKQTENDELIQNLEEEGKQALQQIELALKRLKSGAYLKCINCDTKISEARLNTIPYADKCIQCASAAE